MPRRLPVVFSLALFSLDLGCTSDDSPGTDEVSAGDTMGTDGTDTMGTDTMGTDTTGTDTTGELSGQELYVSFCSACHGPEGEGSTIAYEIRHPHDDFSRWVVRNGRTSVEFANQAMPQFTTALLSDAELDLILEYLDGLPQPDTAEGLYLDYCRNCHGIDAAGGVVNAPLGNSPIQDFIENTRQGFGGSNYGARNLFMPTRTTAELSDAEIQLIFDYVQSL